jgi:hypothetical protein
MPKYGPAGFGVIPAQLRPDIEVITDPRPRWRFHGPSWGEGEWPVFPPEAGAAAGKYLPRKFVKTPEQAEDHIRVRHGGVNVEVVHRDDKEPAKYVFPPGLNVKRIELHPMATELLAKAERVFFVLEGSLKNDAVLSAGGAVFNVASVTLWDPGELDRFARAYLRGKVVIVVPDADWFDNDFVDRQALHVRTALRHLGIDAYIAAPPIEFMKIVDGKKKDQGVDDFLGAGYLLDDLIVRGKEAGRGVYQWDYLTGGDHSTSTHEGKMDEWRMFSSTWTAPTRSSMDLSKSRARTGTE